MLMLRSLERPTQVSPGGGAEGQRPDGVVVSHEAPVGQQGERLRLPQAQQGRLSGQIPQADYAWRDNEDTKLVGTQRNTREIIIKVDLNT